MATPGRKRADGRLPWLAHWREDNGRQRTKTFETKRAAERWEQGKRRERDDQVLGVRSRSHETTLSEWIQTWWDLHMGDNPRHTREGYARVINKYLAVELGAVPMAQLTPGRIARMRDELIADGENPSSVGYALSVLSSALGKAVERDLLPSNPCANVSKPTVLARGTRKLRWPPDPEAVELVRAEMLRYRAPNSDAWYALRSATIVSVLAYAGLRTEEMIALKLGAFDREARLLIVEDVFALEHRPGDTKTHYQRVVELEDFLCEDLSSWIGASRPAGRGSWLFPSRPGGEVEYHTHNNWAKRPWKRARARVVAQHPEHERTLAAAMPRHLRSAYVSLLARAGYSDADIAEMSGHSIDVLRRHYMGALRRLRRLERRPIPEQVALARKAAESDDLAHAAFAELSRPAQTHLDEVVAARPSAKS